MFDIVNHYVLNQYGFTLAKVNAKNMFGWIIMGLIKTGIDYKGL